MWAQERDGALDPNALTNRMAAVAFIRALVTTMKKSIDKTLWRNAVPVHTCYLAVLQSWGCTLKHPATMSLGAITGGVRPEQLNHSLEL